MPQAQVRVERESARGKAVASLFGLREPVARPTPAGRSMFWEEAGAG